MKLHRRQPGKDGKMWRYIIEKSPPLHGEVEASISKNSVLPLMAASLLTEEPVTLTHAPKLQDVRVMTQLLEAMGVEVEMKKTGMRLQAQKVKPCSAPLYLTRQLRASFIVLGPLAARFGQAFVPLPGGCGIGARPVDLHLKGLTQMGARITGDRGGITCRGRLEGAPIYLDYPSVGCTENLMMAASLARGQTILYNAAREPEIVDLARMLNKMGAKISGAGTGTVIIDGQPALSGARYRPIPDRIEAGTYLYAAALTRGNVRVNAVDPDHLQPVVAKLKLAGCDVETGDDWVRVSGAARPQAVDIQTLPWPGFPTDMQSAAMVLSSVAQGTSLIQETVFENRFLIVPELVRMGASVRVQGAGAVVEGVARLKGAQVEATDLRAGAALVLAGMAAEGKTTVLDDGHIRRGYEDLPGKLAALGASISGAEQV
jgi:UDP-N-acetylglucosamine 1-carboxyvinyltransferase